MRNCARCGVSEEHEMLALNGPELVCQDCDSQIDRERCEETGERHYLDTFVGAEERDI